MELENFRKKVSEFPTRAIVPEKASFCSLHNFQKPAFDLRSTQNSKQDRLKIRPIRSPKGDSRKAGSYSSQNRGFPGVRFDPKMVFASGYRHWKGGEKL